MPAAILVLEDGRSFRGESFGAAGETFGELSVSTGVVDCQEVLASQEHSGRIVLFTTPHIGSTGWNDHHATAKQIAATGLIVRDPVPRPSNWQATRALEEVLQEQQIVAISGIDTRALFRHLRERGTTRAAIASTDLNPDTVLQRLRQQTSSTRKNSGKDA